MKRCLVVVVAVLGVGCVPPSTPRDKEQPAQPQAPDLPAKPGPRPPGPPPSLTTVQPTAAAFSPDGKWVLVGYQWEEGEPPLREVKSVSLWEVATGKELWHAPGHLQKVSFVAFLPDGERAVSADLDGVMRIWDIAAGKPIRMINLKGGVTSGALSPDGKRILFGVGDGTLQLWDIASSEVVRTFQGKQLASIISMAFSPDGAYALSGCNSAVQDKRSVVLWRVVDGKEVRRPDPQTAGWMWGGAFSPDSRYAVTPRWSAEQDAMRLVIWDVQTGREVRELEGEGWEPIAFTPDGKHILATSAAVIGSRDKPCFFRKWDAATGKELWSARAAMPRGAQVLAFSADRRLAFTAGGQDTVHEKMCLNLWDATEGKHLCTLAGTFVPEGQAPKQ
jgi:WD40 repeat protein